MRILLDPGHGGSDSGAVGINGRLEKQENLKAALIAKSLLQKAGVIVDLTRTDDSFIELKERCNIANRINYDCIISFHRNGFYSPSANGFECWVDSKSSAKITEWGESIAREISSLGMTVRGTGCFKGSTYGNEINYAINRDTKAPSIILELGFITNLADNKIFDEKLEEIVSGIVKATLEFLAFNNNSEILEDKVYTVVSGVFQNFSNATSHRDALIAAGFDAFIK